MSKQKVKSQSVYKRKLKCGATLLVQQTPQFNTAAIGMWIPVGSVHEKISAGVDEGGLSHFLEHLLFKGTKHRTSREIAAEIENVGGDFNAFTTREYTCFHTLILKKEYRRALNVMADVLQNPLFSPSDIRLEREVVVQEIAMVDDNPEERVMDLLYETLFKKHPLARSISGTVQSVRAFDRKLILDFFQRHYAPENLVITVVGDVPIHALEKYLDSIFVLKTQPVSDKQKTFRNNSPLMRAKNQHLLPQIKNGKVVRKSSKLDQAHVVFGARVPPYNSDDYYPLVVLSNILGGGMSSRLFYEVRERRGLAYNIYSNVSAYLDSGVFMVYGACERKNIQKMQSICMRELKRLSSELITATEVQASVTNLTAMAAMNLDSSESRMMAIAKNQMYLGRQVNLKTVQQKLNALTPKHLLTVAKAYLSPDAFVRVVLG